MDTKCDGALHREVGIVEALVDSRIREHDVLLEDQTLAEAVGHGTRSLERAGVDVRGESERAAVPRFGGAAVGLGVVGPQLPAGEVIEEGALVVLKEGDIDVTVVSGLAAEPRVDGPAAAEGPPVTEGRHEVGDSSDTFKN